MAIKLGEGRGKEAGTAVTAAVFPRVCWGDGEVCEVVVPEGALRHTCSEPGTPGGLCWQRPPLFLRGLANSVLAVQDPVAIEMWNQLL